MKPFRYIFTAKIINNIKKLIDNNILFKLVYRLDCIFNEFIQYLEKMNTANVIDDLINKRKCENLSRLRTSIVTKIDNVVGLVRERMKGAGERFVKIMMTLSIIKLAIAMITLIVMTVLFFAHLHTFDPITLQFSKWVSTPLISFIVVIIAIKFAGISIGLTLTIMSVKKITFESMRLRFMEYCKLRLSVFFRRKEHFQRA